KCVLCRAAEVVALEFGDHLGGIKRDGEVGLRLVEKAGDRVSNDDIAAVGSCKSDGRATCIIDSGAVAAGKTVGTVAGADALVNHVRAPVGAYQLLPALLKLPLCLAGLVLLANNEELHRECHCSRDKTEDSDQEQEETPPRKAAVSTLSFPHR